MSDRRKAPARARTRPVRPAPEQEAAAAQDEGLERRFNSLIGVSERLRARIREDYPGLPEEDREEYLRLYGA